MYFIDLAFLHETIISKVICIQLLCAMVQVFILFDIAIILLLTILPFSISFASFHWVFIGALTRTV